jgi:hypothetical protein
MDVVKEVQRLIKAIEEAKTDLARLEGQETALMVAVKGVSNTDDFSKIPAIIEKMGESSDKLLAEAQSLLKELKDEYNW